MTIGTVTVAAVLTLGAPAVSAAEPAAVVVANQQAARSSWQFDRASTTRDHWKHRRQRLQRMRQRLQTHARVRTLARARALDRAFDRPRARALDRVFHRTRARALDRVFHRARMKARWWHNEWRRRQHVFDRLDRNGDGMLSDDELHRRGRLRPLR